MTVPVPPYVLPFLLLKPFMRPTVSRISPPPCYPQCSLIHKNLQIYLDCFISYHLFSFIQKLHKTSFKIRIRSKRSTAANQTLNSVPSSIRPCLTEFLLYVSPSLFSLSFPLLLLHTTHLLSSVPHHILLLHPRKCAPKTNSNWSSLQFYAHRSTSLSPKPSTNTCPSTHIPCRMDFGLTSGNYIILPKPPSNITWSTEEEVLFYLSWTNEAHTNLLKQADKKHFSSGGDIWVHHKLFFVPFLIPPNMTDDALLSILTKYLVPVRKQSTVPHFLAVSIAPYRLPTLSTWTSLFVSSPYFCLPISLYFPIGCALLYYIYQPLTAHFLCAEPQR